MWLQQVLWRSWIWIWEDHLCPCWLGASGLRTVQDSGQWVKLLWNTSAGEDETEKSAEMVFKPWDFVLGPKLSELQKGLKGINCQSAAKWLPVWILLCHFDIFSVCLPLISSIKLHKSNHLCCLFHSSMFLSSLTEQFDVFSQSCLIRVFVTLTSFASERVNHSVGNWFWLLPLWVVTARQLWFLGSRRLCFARRSSLQKLCAFVPIPSTYSQPSKRITVGLWVRVCLLFVSSEKKRSESSSIFVQ